MNSIPEIGSELVFVPEKRFGRIAEAPRFEGVTVISVGREYFYVDYTESLKRRKQLGHVPRRAPKLMKVKIAGWRVKADYDEAGGVYLSEAHYHERQQAQTAYTYLIRVLQHAPCPIGFVPDAAADVLTGFGFDERTITKIQKDLKEHLHKA